MKLRDVVSRLSIDRRKFREYALDSDNPVGQHKAAVFQRRLGYSKANYQSLFEQIEAQVIDCEAVATKLDDYGQRYQVDLEVMGVEADQREVVRTGWIVEPDAEDCARLVTLYVRK